MSPAKGMKEEYSGMRYTTFPGHNLLVLERTSKLLKSSAAGTLQDDEQFILLLLVLVNRNNFVGDTGEED